MFRSRRSHRLLVTILGAWLLWCGSSLRAPDVNAQIGRFIPPLNNPWQPFFCIDDEICHVGDFNGDGRTDIITFLRSTQDGDPEGDVFVAISSGLNFGDGARWASFFCIGDEVCEVGDFDGDGRADVITFLRSTQGGDAEGDVFVALSTGTEFGGGARWDTFFCVADEVCGVGDFNGDARDDIVAFARGDEDDTAFGDVFVALSDGAAFGAGTLWRDRFCTGAAVCATGDFDGDGRDDVVSFVRSSQSGEAEGDVLVALSTGLQFDPVSRWATFFCVEDEVCGVGDFNGDGRDDIVAFRRTTSAGDPQGHVFVALSKGFTFGPGMRWETFFCINQEICRTGDFDGDGQDDIAAFARDSTETDDAEGDVYVAISARTHFFPFAVRR